MAAQQDEGIPIISAPCPTVPEPHGLPVPGPSGVLTPTLATSHLPVSSLPDIPLAGTPLLGHPFADLAIPSKGKWDHCPSDHPTVFTLREPVLPPQKLRLGVSAVPHRTMTIHSI